MLPSVKTQPDLELAEKITPRFSCLETRIEHEDQPICELEWLEDVKLGRSRAVLWEANQGFVAPLSYRRHACFDEVCSEFAGRGWPVRVRRSGGGLVPQGPGMLNLSLTYPVAGTPGLRADGVYEHLCDLLTRALAQIGITAYPATVTGSFCDGRFNLAVATACGLRKIAGTAQYWRRCGKQQAVLAHALLLVAADTDILTRRCNEFELALGSGRQYDPEALTNVAQAWCDAHPDGAPVGDISSEVTRQIAAALMQ